MFYCEPCGVKNKWPVDFWLPASHGPCEMCGEVATCLDVPSSALPPAPREPDYKITEEP